MVSSSCYRAAFARRAQPNGVSVTTTNPVELDRRLGQRIDSAVGQTAWAAALRWALRAGLSGLRGGGNPESC